MTSLHPRHGATTGSSVVNDLLGCIPGVGDLLFFVALPFSNEPLVAPQFPVSQTGGSNQSNWSKKHTSQKPAEPVVAFVVSNSHSQQPASNNQHQPRSTVIALET